jgi:hypothetical protein
MNLLSVLAGLDVKRHSRRRRGLAGPNHSARTDPPLAETPDTSSLHGQHKIISDGKIIAMAAGKTKNSWLLTPKHRQRVQGCPQTSNPPWKYGFHTSVTFGGQTQMVAKTVLKPIAKQCENTRHRE